MDNGLSATIIENKQVKEFSFADTPVLTTDIDNFKVKLTNRFPEFMINRVLAMQETAFINNNARVLYPQAVADYKNSVENAYPFNPHGAFLTYEVTYNQHCVLSFYDDNYTYTGGAHGNTIRKSNTFHLQTGKQIPLSYFFNNPVTYKQRVLHHITEQAKQMQSQNPNTFFEDYLSLIRKYFNEESFYLSTEGLVFYYGQYEIAPYASGIIEFMIPYKEVDNVPKCN